IGQAVILVSGTALLVSLAIGAPAAAVLPVLFVMVAATPTVMGTASALAIGRARHAAGTASALMGALQFTLGAVVSPLVGLGGPATGVPMGIMIVVCACLGMVARRIAATAGELVRPEREPTPA
ncbi:MAG: Bcr/CflA family drug resistance efflux transporter, partial [Nocardia sp.]|nr:Bcr/CflA family drug resistance efflux transporter [Nocardia sp.]